MLGGYRHVCAFFSSPKEEYDDPVICTYDVNLLNATLAIDILRTHPVVIIAGVLHENPFFVRPDEFLQEFLSRSGEKPKP